MVWRDIVKLSMIFSVYTKIVLQNITEKENTSQIEKVMDISMVLGMSG